MTRPCTKSLLFALTILTLAACISEIWVAQGVYKPSRTPCNDIHLGFASTLCTRDSAAWLHLSQAESATVKEDLSDVAACAEGEMGPGMPGPGAS